MAKDNKPGFKHTALGWIPEDWEIKTVQELCSIYVGKDLKEDNFSSTKDENYKYPVYSNTVENEGLYGFYNIAEYIGDSLTIVGRGAGLGTAFTRKHGYGAIGRLLILFPNEKNNAHYITEYVNHKLRIHQESSGIPQLTGEQISNYKISIPGYSEQTRIAQLLSTWDRAIETTQKLIAQKELSKKWLMQMLLTGKKRLKGFSGEWKEVKIEDIFERITRRNLEGNTNVVTISAQRGFIRQEDFFNKLVASESLDNYFLVEKGEFCYNKSYSNGYPWGATKRLNDFDKAVVTTLYICFAIKDQNKNSGVFFEQFFEANLLDKGLTQIAHEGGRAHGLLNVTPSDFFALKIRIPEYEEQTVIAQVLQSANAEIRILKTKLDKLKEQKKGLMQVLLTGTKRLIQ